MAEFYSSVKLLIMKLSKLKDLLTLFKLFLVMMEILRKKKLLSLIEIRL